eukprot:TRINITY_DN2235_c0_g2_i1.p1 TRINITY_DN2235_c0_g2~~TRINITY_DN2235_c0_g2_i1.p1  ORF type:complete len:1400 (-),score=292.55 TRINITY_DN2235_c0_g2_i1:276-4475(-)
MDRKLYIIKGQRKVFNTVAGICYNIGSVIMNVKMATKNVKWKFEIIEGDKILLGMDILRHLKLRIDLHKMIIKIGKGARERIMYLNRRKKVNNGEKYDVIMKEDCTIKARTICNIPVVVSGYYTGAILFESVKSEFFPRTVTTVWAGESILSVINSTEDDLNFKKGEVIGKGSNKYEVEEMYEVKKSGKVSAENTESIFSMWISEEFRKESEDHSETINNIENNSNNNINYSKTCEQLIKEKISKYKDLTSDQRRKLEEVLLEYGTVFSNKLNKGGQVSTYPINIKIKDGVNPVCTRRHNLSEKENEIVDKEVEELKATGIIEDSVSPWESPVVIVKKPDGSNRFCIDYRRVNKLVEKDSYPLPNIDVVMRGFAGCMFFTKMDFASGYFQVGIEEKDRPITAFSTRKGKYHFKTLPQGFINSSSVFQRTMNMILSGLSWEFLLVYIDDILIFSKTFEQHITQIKAVLERLRKNNLIIKLSKCEFARSELLFLGHIINKAGISTDPRKTNIISKCAAPGNQSELRSFLGCTGYYRKFIHKYSDITVPLRESVNNKTWTWGKEQEDAFNLLKKLLCESPVLRHPDFTKPFKILCDASGYAAGIILEQDNHPIWFYSQRFTKTECRYGITERECLALVLAVKKFRQFIHGKPFTVVTDHSALKFLFENKNHVSKLMRWSLELQEYAADMTIVFKPGVTHSAPDALSREPLAKNGFKLSDWFNVYEETNFVDDYADNIDIVYEYSDEEMDSSSSEEEVDNKIVKKRTDFKYTPRDKEYLERVAEDNKWFDNERKVNDEKYKKLDKLLGQQIINKESDLMENKEDISWEDVEPPQFSEIGQKQLLDKDAEPILTYLAYGKLPVEGKETVIKISRECIYEDGQLYKVEWTKNTCAKCLWIPKCMINEVIADMHGAMLSGHSGFDKTLLKTRERYYFPNMYSEVKKWVQTCKECQERKGLTRKEYGSLNPLEHPSYPFERVAMDIVGPLVETTQGNKYILTIMDYHTRWPEAISLKDAKAHTVAKAYIDVFISRYGCPRIVLTDLGSNFNSHLMEEVNKILQTKHRTTTPYRPQTNGMIERFHAPLITSLSYLCSVDQTDWDEYVPLALFVYRSSVNTTIEMSPFKALFGFNASLPQEITYKIGKHGEDIEQRLDMLKRLRMDIPEIVKRQQNIMKENWNKRRHPNEKFEKGEAVWVKNKPISKKDIESKKLSKKFNGPCIVVKRTGDLDYVLRNALTGKSQTQHVSKLKRARLTKEDMKFYKDEVEKFEKEEKRVNELDKLITREKEKRKGKEKESDKSDSESEDEEAWKERMRLEEEGEYDDKEWEVEQVLDHRDTDEGRYYLLKWKGWPMAKNSWTHKSETGCKDLVEDYLDKKKNNIKKKDVKFTDKQEKKRWDKRRRPAKK